MSNYPYASADAVSEVYCERCRDQGRGYRWIEFPWESAPIEYVSKETSETVYYDICCRGCVIEVNGNEQAIDQRNKVVYGTTDRAAIAAAES